MAAPTQNTGHISFLSYTTADRHINTTRKYTHIKHSISSLISDKYKTFLSVHLSPNSLRTPPVPWLFLLPPTNSHKCVTIIVEITNKLLRHVSTHEVSSSGNSLVLAKLTYE